MKTRALVDGVTTPDGRELTLVRHGRDFFIQIDGDDLMSNRRHGSEIDLARLAVEELGPRSAPRVLVGGLGMGFTLRAALDAVDDRPGATVTVAEVFEAVVSWSREHVGALAGHPLADPRTRVHVGDVRLCLEGDPGGWDLILLDVDNGPAAFTLDSNRSLYSSGGLVRLYRSLAEGGVLAVWSAGEDPEFVRRLERAGFEARSVRSPTREGDREGWHVIFLARHR